MSAIKAYNKYNILPSDFRVVYFTLFSLPKEFKPALKTYYLLHWEAYYVSLKLGIERETDKLPTISRLGIEYTVVWHGISRSELSKLVKDNPTARILLSFREAAPEFDFKPIVLISKGN